TADPPGACGPCHTAHAGTSSDPEAIGIPNSGRTVGPSASTTPTRLTLKPKRRQGPSAARVREMGLATCPRSTSALSLAMSAVIESSWRFSGEGPVSVASFVRHHWLANLPVASLVHTGALNSSQDTRYITPLNILRQR